MAYRDLDLFLRSLAMHASVRAAFKRDPEAVMAEAGLTEREKKLVRSKDAKAIKKYLGDQYAAALLVNVE